MTQTTQTDTPTGPSTGAATPRHPGDLLMNLIAALLAPIFLGVAGGDTALARQAVIEAINDYRARNHADLIAAAQVISFGLAALGSLSLSMADDLSLPMILRLRGNAVSLNRSAEQNRRVLREPLRDNPTPYHPVTEPEPTPPKLAEHPRQTLPEAFLSAAAAEELAAESRTRLQPPAQTAAPAPTPTPAQHAAPTSDLKTEEKRHQEMWAIAMANEASEITASIPNLPPVERSTASFRAAALSSTANQLLMGGRSPLPIPPGDITSNST
jgi:hypothetical protein